MSRRLGAAVLALACVAAGPAPEAEEEISLTQMVRFVAEKTQHAYLIDGSVKRKKIRLISPTGAGLEGLDPQTLTRVFHAALDAAGVSVVPGEKFSRLVGASEAKAHDIPVFTTPEQLPRDDRRITAMVPLRHIPVDDAVSLLKPLLSKEAVLVPDHRGGRLIFVERSQNLRRLLKMLRQLDQPTGADDGLYIIELHNADAADVAGKLEAIGER